MHWFVQDADQGLVVSFNCDRVPKEKVLEFLAGKGYGEHFLFDLIVAPFCVRHCVGGIGDRSGGTLTFIL